MSYQSWKEHLMGNFLRMKCNCE